MRRILDICVISDTHLGTYGCHADELLKYLRSIKPRILILNGDIIDAWQFRKNYFPRVHLEIIHHIIQMSIQGTKVYYLTGNHDDFLRRFSNLTMGPISLKDNLVLSIQGKQYWFFHGDIFDASVLISPGLAKLGGKGYDWLIRLNRFINIARGKLGLPQVSFAHVLKSRVKRAVKYISDFERMAIDQARKRQYNYVICGHIHRPCIKEVALPEGSLFYLNSGDWVENLSALEFKDGVWRLFQYNDTPHSHQQPPKAMNNDVIDQHVAVKVMHGS